MPRSIEFEIDSALCTAMSEFRRHGFEGTSIKSLEQATGLSSGSLYNSFGDKSAIFVKALSHYNRVVVMRRIEEHLLAKPPAKGLRSLFLSLLEEPAGGTSGCLLTNSAIEFGAGDSIAKNGVREGFRLLEEAFRTVVGKVYPGCGTKSEPISLKLLALYQGVLVLVRFGHPKPTLRKMITNELDTLLGGTDG
jgi:TetR/AcrR family transcriptional regulator, transcriptional repressor for nem operon